MSAGVLRSIVILLVLTGVWTLLWDRPTVGTAVVGAAGVLVIMVVRRLLPGTRRPGHSRVYLLPLVLVAVVVAGEVVLSSLQVAWWAVRPGPVPRASVVQVPLRLRNEGPVAALVHLLNLIPGGVVLDVDRPREVLHAHVFTTHPSGEAPEFLAQAARIEELLRRSLERGETPSPAAPSASFDSTPASPTWPRRRNKESHA